MKNFESRASVSQDRRQILVSCLLGLLLVVGLVAWSYDLFHFNLRIPIEFRGDSVLTMSSLQNMIHGGWYFETRQLGYPTGQALQDYPAVADGLLLVASRLLTVLSQNPAVAFNVLFLAAFPLNYLGCFVGLRILRVSGSLSAILSVVYAVVPFNFLHGPGHVGLVWNFGIPIWLAFVIRQSSDDPVIPDGTKVLAGGSGSRRAALVVLLIGVLGGATGFYYFVFFLLAAIPIGINEVRKQRNLRSAWILISAGVAMAVFMIQVIPILVFQSQYGGNSSAARRTLGELAFYGLKPVGLIVSAPYSRLKDLTGWLDSFETNSENATSLGLVLGLALVFLLLIALFRTKQKRLGESLILYYLFIGMPFGGGYLIGLLGFTQLRVWSRLSIVLAALVILNLSKWIATAAALNAGRAALVGSLVVAGVLIQVLDTVPENRSQAEAGIDREWGELRDFTARIDRRYGEGLAIFQLPIIPFPENPPVGRMTDYEHLKPYLLNSDMRFSYGGIKGRTIPWQERLGSDPASQIKGIRVAGFDGVWVDRFGWNEATNPYEPILANEYGLKPIVSETGRYIFYKFPNAPEGPASVSEDRLRRSILTPIVASFGAGFSEAESDGTRSWRWAGKSGQINFLNLSRRRERVEVSLTVELRGEGSLLLPEACSVRPLEDPLLIRAQCTIVVAKSGASLRLETTLQSIDDDDPRDLRFRVLELELMSHGL